MAVDFPNAPFNGQSFVPPNGAPYNWDGVKWAAANATGAFLPLAGGTLTGKLTTVASAAAAAGFNLPQGAAPTTPANGDLWTTTLGLYAQINGATVNFAPLASPTFTGTPSLPTGAVGVTQTAGNSSTALATTAFVATSFAPLASPAFTGNVTVAGNLSAGGSLFAFGGTSFPANAQSGQFFGNSTFNLIISSMNNAELAANLYWSSAGNWIYRQANPGSLFNALANGSFAWWNAPSGAAGANATITQTANLDASGNLSTAGSLLAFGGTSFPASAIGGHIACNSGTHLYLSSIANVYNCSNLYQNTGGNWIYRQAVAASLFIAATDGTFSWWNAPTGTAGATAGVTERMSLDATGHLVVSGYTSVQASPTAAWGFDADGCQVTIANGGNAALPAGSGLVMLNCQNISGDVGLYMCGGGSVVLVSAVDGGTGAFVAPTTAPAAGKASVAWSGSAYCIYSNVGSTQAFRVMTLRVRASY